MKRRDFIKKGAGAAAMTGLALSSPYTFGSVFNSNDPFDMVAVKGGEPDIMFDRGIESMGGMKNFVKAGQSVLIKPNIGWDAVPERAANTNPLLINRIVKHCYEAGAKDVLIFDNTCDKWNKCYSNSGIEKAGKDAGAKIVPGNTESYYQEVEVTDGVSLKTTKVHELMLSSDVFINVPVLKSHSSAKLTIGMKNLMGVVWDRMWWHRNDLQQCIADFASWRKPDLTIIDAYNVMMQNGPRGVSTADVKNMKSQILSTDVVAADAAAAKMFGLEPYEIPHIEIADEMGIGTMDLTELNIDRIIL